MPAASILELFGIQYSEPDTSVVPPALAARSTMSTSAPACRAVTAAAKAAPPEPTTMTSASRSQLSGRVELTSGPAVGAPAGVASCAATSAGALAARAEPMPAERRSVRRLTREAAVSVW